jgi:hypothetical protein
MQDRSKDLSSKIEEGLGRQGLGIVSITGVSTTAAVLATDV